MIDFNNAPRQQEEQSPRPQAIAGDPVAMFISRLAEFSLNPGTIELDEKLHRFDVDKKNDKAGWYVYYGGDIAAGSFGSWKGDIKKTWCSKSISTLTWAERNAYEQKLEQAKKRRRQEEETNHANARIKANKIWNESTIIIGDDHPYLKKKGIQAHHTRLTKSGDLAVPQLDADGNVWSLQFINTNKKIFQPFGKRHGLYFEMPGNANIVLCEGFSTGATIHECTSSTVICAFNAGSMVNVARLLKDKYRGHNFTVAADNDQFQVKNVGMDKAKEAAAILGAEVVFPTFENIATKPTDFNDLAALEGGAAVVLQLSQVGKEAPFPPLYEAMETFKGRVMSRPKDKEFILNCWGKGFLPKGVVGILSATGGTGKTFFLMLLAAMAAKGGKIGPLTAPKPLKTLIICGEDDNEEVSRRMWDCCDDGEFPDGLAGYSVYGQVGPLMELDGNKPVRAAGFHWLEESIKGFPGLKLLIFDPKSRFYGLDENNNDHATQWVSSLEYLAHKYKITILFTSHTSDSNSGTISQVMNRGASAIVDGCRWQSGMIRMSEETAGFYGISDRENYVEFGTPKNNYAANQPDSLFFKRTTTGSLVYVDLKTEGGLHKHIFEYIAKNPEHWSRREYLKSAAFNQDVKEKYPDYRKETPKEGKGGLYAIFDSLISAGRISEQGGYNATVLLALK